jgi:uncharacterized membrane protein
MSPGTIFGLALIAAGILAFIGARPLTNAAVNSQTYFRPSLDKEAWKRKNVRGARIIGICWIVLGALIAVYGVVTGH